MATLNVNEKAVLKLFPCLTPNPRGGDQWDASLRITGINSQVELKAKDESEKLTWNSNKADIPMLARWEKERDFYLYSEYNKPNTPTLANEHYIMFRKMPWHYISEGGWRVHTCQDIKDAVAHQIKTYGSL